MSPIEEILPSLYRIEVPLPQNPLRSINVYVIKDPVRSLIVDTGMNRPECRTALEEGIAALDLDLSAADVFVTHLHADHLGLAKALVRPGTSVFLSRLDRAWLEAWDGWESFFPLAEAHGVPADELRAEVAANPSLAFQRDWLPEFTPVEGGGALAAGPYRFQLVATPGHTAGHLCLYEPEARVLLSGDHILGDISPNITSWVPGRNPLKEYFASLAQTARLEIDVVLPGHRALVRDHRARIAEIRLHHERRLDEVRSLLAGRRLTAFDLAAQMTWDLRGRWAGWPMAQKWFATGEAIAHVVYLESLGEVAREPGERVVFRA